MAFTVNDLQDLTRLLRERPEWLSEVQRIVLTDELLALPRELAEAQRRTDEHFAELAKAQQRNEEQLAELRRRNEEQLAELRRQTDARFAELAEAQRRNEEQLAELRRQTDARFAELAEAQRRIEEQLAELRQRTEEQLAELRRQTDARFAELAEAQRRIEEQLAELRQRTEEQLAELRQRTEEQLAELRQRTEEQLAELRRQTDARFAELAEAIRQLTLRFEESQQRNEDRFAEIRGELLEIRYRNKVGAIFGSRLRRPRVVDGGDVWDMLRGRLDEGEIRRIVAADLIVRGGLLPPQGEGELWLVVEVSGVIDRNDVARAAERAALLRKAGLLVVPVAAGERLTQGALTLSEEFGVALARDGGLAGWDEAMAKALPPKE
jgi:ribosomal protein L32E